MTTADALRPTLYGDVPLDRWPGGDHHRAEAWASFVFAAATDPLVAVIRVSTS